MICPKCGNQVRDGVRFCPTCGSPQVAQPSQQINQQSQQQYGTQRQPQQFQTYQQQAQVYGSAGRPVSSSRLFAMIGMIAAIVGLVLLFLNVPWQIKPIIPLAAIVVSGVGIKRNEGGMAIAGLVIGVVALVFALIILFVCGGIEAASHAAYNELANALADM